MFSRLDVKDPDAYLRVLVDGTKQFLAAFEFFFSLFFLRNIFR
jgi:hypothetical protein